MNDREIVTFMWNPKSLAFWRVKVNVDDVEWIENEFDVYWRTKYYHLFPKEDIKNERE